MAKEEGIQIFCEKRKLGGEAGLGNINKIELLTTWIFAREANDA